MSKFLTFTLLLFSIMSYGQTVDSVSYQIGDQSFTAYFALPKKLNAKTKTVLIVHEWWGLNDYPKMRAQKLSELGMIGFCIDMYGTGNIADNPTDAQALAMPLYKDPQMAFERFMAGYTEALKIKGVNKEKMAGIGYCFGGSMVLNAAKMGAPLDAVVSFHGGLAGIPVDKDKLKAKVLICNGAADGFVSAEEIAAFKKQMDENAIFYQFIDYADATHAFTNPQSTVVGEKFSMPIKYNEAADQKSWKDFMAFMKKYVN